MWKSTCLVLLSACFLTIRSSEELSVTAFQRSPVAEQACVSPSLPQGSEELLDALYEDEEYDDDYPPEDSVFSVNMDAWPDVGHMKSFDIADK